MTKTHDKFIILLIIILGSIPLIIIASPFLFTLLSPIGQKEMIYNIQTSNGNIEVYYDLGGALNKDYIVVDFDNGSCLFKIIKNSFTVEGISIKNSSVLIILQDSINNREESISMHFPQKQSTT